MFDTETNDLIKKFKERIKTYFENVMQFLSFISNNWSNYFSSTILFVFWCINSINKFVAFFEFGLCDTCVMISYGQFC